MLIYRALRKFLRFVARVFFRDVDVVGLEHVPDEGAGAVIFVGNHPNSLIDPVLMIAFSGRIMHFAAKDTLFQSRLLRLFLRPLGAVPVARRADHADGATALANDLAFESMWGVLAKGRAIGVFPEGLSHDGAEIARLKTGAARIALGFAARHPDAPLRIVPCGLTYVRRKRFRSRALIQFGAPLSIDAERSAAFAKDDRDAVRSLTADIETALRALTVNAPDWETLRVLDGVRRLYQPPNVSLPDRVELQRRFTTVYQTVKNEPIVADLFARVAAYIDRLRESGLTDRDLRRTAAPRDAAWRVLRHLVLILVWVPLALPGAVLNAPVGILAVWAGQNLTPRKDVIATTKLIAGLFGSFLVYVAMIVATAYWGDAAFAVLAAVAIPVTGIATLRVLDRGPLLIRWFRTFARLLNLHDEIAALRAERAELEADVVAAVDRFRPADMIPLFPRGAAASNPPRPPA
ncbi:MAG: 1-acyl-sn-glycerol-3-phosphate acyltransferase [Deltaproteobacteria bacterium]|nr:1-acyl-sn-glycerol-3-phosphate acyltransferase [Deltaproteobacteria bacterium]